MLSARSLVQTHLLRQAEKVGIVQIHGFEGKSSCEERDMKNHKNQIYF